MDAERCCANRREAYTWARRPLTTRAATKFLTLCHGLPGVKRPGPSVAAAA